MDIVGAAFEASDSLRWRFAGTGVVLLVMVVLPEGSSRSRLSLLDLWDWRLSDIILLLSSRRRLVFNVEEWKSVSRSRYSEVDVKIPGRSVEKKKPEVWWIRRELRRILGMVSRAGGDTRSACMPASDWSSKNAGKRDSLAAS